MCVCFQPSINRCEYEFCCVTLFKEIIFRSPRVFSPPFQLGGEKIFTRVDECQAKFGKLLCVGSTSELWRSKVLPNSLVLKCATRFILCCGWHTLNFLPLRIFFLCYQLHHTILRIRYSLHVLSAYQVKQCSIHLWCKL